MRPLPDTGSGPVTLPLSLSLCVCFDSLQPEQILCLESLTKENEKKKKIQLCNKGQKNRIPLPKKQRVDFELTSCPVHLARFGRSLRLSRLD